MYVRKSTATVVKMCKVAKSHNRGFTKGDIVAVTAARKSTVIRAVMFGLISTDEAIGRYELTQDEFQEWLRSYADYNGLKVIHKNHKQPWVAMYNFTSSNLELTILSFSSVGFKCNGGRNACAIGRGRPKYSEKH